MKRFLTLSFATALFSVKSFAQGEIPVDMYTGRPIIQVPIYSVAAHDIIEPIVLSYDASGVKLEQSAGWYGLGWNLGGGGSVSREVRSLPDDIVHSDGRKGWLYSRSGGVSLCQEIGSFTNSADQSASTCSDETTDYNFINGLTYQADTEADIFAYHFGNYSGQFVFDNTGAIRTIPYRDLKIEFVAESVTDKKLKNFKITTNDGYAYTFSQIVSTTKSATKFSFLNAVTVLNAEYEWYKNSSTFTSEWKLSRIDSPSGAWMSFTYDFSDFTVQRPLTIGKYIYKNPAMLGSTDVNVTSQYSISETSANLYLKQITTSSGITVDFLNNSGSLNKITISDYRKPSGTAYVKEFLFSYQNQARKFLSSVTEKSGCDILPPYKFEYISAENMPDPYSNNKDFWGYYNGENNNENLIPRIYIYPAEAARERYRLEPISSYSGSVIVLNGAVRTPNPSACQAGTLNKIIYPAGGVATLIYESHQYYDAYANQSYAGGGLRVKTVKYFDGINASAEIVKNFSYLDATNKSSGRLITKPVFAFPAYKWKDPNNYNSTNPIYEKLFSGLTGDDQWKYLTLRTEEDISAREETHGSAVGYQQVTVTRTGSGSVKFEYDLPGVYAETANGNWAATVNKFVRPAGCPSLGIISSGGEWLYPNAPNSNYEYERGLLSRKSEYNITGNLIRFTENTYQYMYGSGTQPVTISNLKYSNYALSEDNAPANKIYFYGKYTLLANVDRVLKKETITLYDESDLNKKNISSTEYFYESTAHKLLTRVQSSAGNGTIYTTRLKYLPDFGSIAGNSEPSLLSLKDLYTANRYSFPIEVVSAVQRPGDAEKTTSASLTTFKTFGTTGIFPERMFALEIADPVTDFSNTSVQLQSGTYKLVPDIRYKEISTISGYSQYGLPLTTTGLNKIPQSTLWGYTNTLPVAKFANASSGEFAFSDFESTSDASFQLTNAFYGSGRTGSKSVHPGATLTRSITKAPNSVNYILSFWLKRDVNDVSIQVKIKDASTTYYSTTMVVHPVGSDFEFFRKIIPATNLPASFTVEIKGISPALPGTGSTGLVPVMDDVAFYPEAADFISYTYALPFGPQAVTDSRAATVYTTYDNLGRTGKLLDKDKNILQKTTYRYAAKGALTAEFTASQAFVGEATTFTALGNPCTPGATYKWTINGSVYYGNPLSYTFSTSGNFSASLEVSAAAYTSITSSQPISASYRPLLANICAKGVREFSASTNLVVSSYSCAAITASPATSYGVIFQVATEEGVFVTYQWKRRQAGVSYWTNVGTNSAQYSLAKITSNESTFEVMCEVTSANGRSGSSSVMMVTISL